jgi:hypothetical protein
VIESRTGPVGSRMASGARGGEASRRVRRSVGSGIIRLVAGVAIGRHRCVVVIDMALRASQRGMKAGQGEYCRVIEGRRSPVRRRVA